MTNSIKCLSTSFPLITALLVIATSIPTANADHHADEKWISLFNGENLDGWTPKVNNHPLGDNPGNLFRVEDGLLKVSYDEYETFDGQFAHIFTNNAYSNYILRVDYLFTGEALEDAQYWAKLNSGVMLHCQSPLTMRQDQGFPVSMEFQFLAEGARAGTQTANIVTPGTNVVINGELLTEHIIDSSSSLFPLNQWVTAEVEVHGNGEIIHRINGVEVIRYSQPQLDPSDSDAQALLAAGVPLQLSSGHIALQGESQPIWFRNIMIRNLD